MPTPRTLSILCRALLLAIPAVPGMASALPQPLYLRAGSLLSPVAPSETEPQDDVRASIRAGQRMVLEGGEFTSVALGEEHVAGGAVARLFLVTGQAGMEGCAVVDAELLRLQPPAGRTVVASGQVATSILPRRESVQPIEVPLTATGVLAAAGERLALVIAVTNRCDDLRSPRLLYDGLTEQSAVRFTDAPPATSTTTTTTTTVPGTPGTTTTTLPAPVSCLAQPLTGYQAVFCRVDTIVAILGARDPGDVGGLTTRGRLLARLARSRARLERAQTGRRVRLHLAAARRNVRAFDRLVRRGGRRAVIEPDLVGELTSLGAELLAQIGQLR